MKNKFKTYSLYTLLVVLVAGFSAGFGILSVVLYQVYFGDVSELKKSTILARINEETTIFTNDEQTKLGSFFNEAHRSYVPVDQIPAHMIRAMVASEDQNFYDHLGIDPVAITSAFVDGVKNGFRFRRGGSSITQQTVKNILDRREHTFRRKFKEMIRALQLERMYSKEQILEFYLNQFHVTANGKGVGIAAQYYFSKDVQDLSLVEAAFIAGSVKAPSKYNPFIKYTRKGRETAQLEANRRKNYVLRRMYEQGWITQDELKEAWDKPVPFKQGKFRTREVALVSLIRGQLNKKEILTSLGMESPQELNHAGLRIYTTLDGAMQERAQLMMRRNLSRLEMILQGFATEDAEEFRPLRHVEENQFYYGKVESIKKGKDPEIILDLGLPKATIPADSLMRAAKIYALPTYKGYDYHLKEMFSKIKVGDVLFVEIMSYDAETHHAIAELRRRPRINGGLIAVDHGEVRAVVAGFDAKGFNRAMFATRQPGSIFKSVVYYAALQLGWTVVDRLDNTRRIFPFQGTYYFPRPDHKSPYDDVSLMWAGVKSENLATVFLTANLLDKLNFEEFRELLGSMDLLPKEDEAPRDYHYRVAKTIGVQLENSGVREYLLGRVIQGLRPDLVFSGRMELLKDLSKMWWGRGYLAELKNVYQIDDEEISDRERDIRVTLLKRNFQRLNVLSDDLANDWNLIDIKVRDAGAEGVFSDPQIRQIASRFRVMDAVGGRPTLAYIRELEGEAYVPSDPQQEITLNPPPGRALNPLDIQAIWGGYAGYANQLRLSVDDVLLAGFLPRRYFVRIAAEIEQRYQNIMAQKDRYSLYQYFNHHDFRISVGLHYLKRLAKAMGVYSKMEPVLSFGLGTNDVSVAEVAKIYQTFTNGRIYRFYEEGPQNQLNLIKRIEDRYGNVLFEPKKQEFQLTDPCYASQMSEILRKVVTHGTGRRARGELYIELENPQGGAKEEEKETKIRIPAYGKTGTTNDYTTAYFAGFMPYPTTHRAPLDPEENAMVIASYVGYDLNQTMRRGSFRISGAYGALPVWTDFSKSLITMMDYEKYVDRFDINLLTKQVWPISADQCTAGLKVDLPRGTIMGTRSGDDEQFQFTNIEIEGETFVNEFARNQSVTSFVNLAVVEKDGQLRARRGFQPFQRPDIEPVAVKIIEGVGDDTAVEEEEPSDVDSVPADPSANLEIEPEDPRNSNANVRPSPELSVSERRQAELERAREQGRQRQPDSVDPEAQPDFQEQEGGYEDEELW